jgi:hypothetical protein
MQELQIEKHELSAIIDSKHSKRSQRDERASFIVPEDQNADLPLQGVNSVRVELEVPTLVSKMIGGTERQRENSDVMEMVGID